MKKEIIHRLFSVLSTIFLSTVVIFVLIRMAPGDPVKMFMGTPADMPLLDTYEYEQQVKVLRAELGLDKSVFVQYATWIERLAQCDMGTSIYSKKPVWEEISRRIPATMLLSFSALLIQVFFGIFLGILSALKAGKTLDNIIRFFCVFFASLPGFVLGLTLLFVFAVDMHLYEICNSSNLSRLWLPAITLGLIGIPQLTRMVRVSMLSELGQIYTISALARGVKKSNIVLGALRNALFPITTMITHTFATLMGGSVIIESIFAWPGIGEYALTSVLLHDYPVIQGYAIVTVSIVITINLLGEALYALSDPQIYKKARAKNAKISN